MAKFGLASPLVPDPLRIQPGPAQRVPQGARTPRQGTAAAMMSTQISRGAVSARAQQVVPATRAVAHRALFAGRGQALALRKVGHPPPRGLHR